MKHPPVTSANSYPVVSGLGMVVLDELVFVEQYPTVDSKVFATGHVKQAGGPVPTALAQLQRLGVKTRLLGSWSNDLEGHAVESYLRQQGVVSDPQECRTSLVTGFAHVWIETITGRRTVVAQPPDGTPCINVAEAFGRTAQVLHLDGWAGDAAVIAAKATLDAGGFVTFDAGSIKPATERLLPLANLVNAPKRFINDFCGTEDVEAGANQLLALGPRLVTITDGENAAGLFTPNTSIWRPAFPVTAVDTCGAGDVFCGGLIYAVLTEMQPEETLTFAMAAAAVKVSRVGNRGALASYDEIHRLIASA